MPVSPHLHRKLKESLGQEAGEDLMTWMDQTDSLRGDVAEMRHEMQLGFARMDAKFDAMSLKIEAECQKVRADLMKWSFVFWTGSVLAIAALAGVLRN